MKHYKKSRSLLSRFELSFTLLELLIVIALIMILATMMLPALKNSRNMARGIACMSNTKQIGIAMNYYVNDNAGYFTPTGPPGGNDYWWPQNLVLSRYVAEKSFHCPVLPSEAYFSWTYPHYGANLKYILTRNGASVPALINQIKNPARMILLSDSQNVGVFTNGIQRGYLYIFAAPTHLYEPHERHQDGFNISWIDGHCSYMKASLSNWMLKYDDNHLGEDNKPNSKWNGQ